MADELTSKLLSLSQVVIRVPGGCIIIISKQQACNESIVTHVMGGIVACDLPTQPR